MFFGSFRFAFTMDGKKYPARLVDMPCVLESQKTLDKNTFFKSGDIGQMLIVYKVESERERERDANTTVIGRPRRGQQEEEVHSNKAVAQKRKTHRERGRGLKEGHQI